MTEPKKATLASLQQHILEIAQELDQVRASSPKDASIINLNIGRLQGLAQGIGWVYLDNSPEKPPAVGFNFKEFGTLSPDEEEHEGDDDNEA